MHVTQDCASRLPGYVWSDGDAYRADSPGAGGRELPVAPLCLSPGVLLSAPGDHHWWLCDPRRGIYPRKCALVKVTLPFIPGTAAAAEDRLYGLIWKEKQKHRGHLTHMISKAAKHQYITALFGEHWCKCICRARVIRTCVCCMIYTFKTYCMFDEVGCEIFCFPLWELICTCK